MKPVLFCDVPCCAVLSIAAPCRAVPCIMAWCPPLPASFLCCTLCVSCCSDLNTSHCSTLDPARCCTLNSSALLQAVAHVEPVPVWLPDQGSVVSTLDEAVSTSAAAGHPVKALLLTNPRNPQVRSYSAINAAPDCEL